MNIMCAVRESPRCSAMTRFPTYFLFFLTVWLPGAGMQFVSGSLAAQTASAKRTFEVATIRPSPPPDPAKIRAEIQAGRLPRVGPHVTASRAEYISMNLKDLIALGWRLRGYQVTGPEWLGSERFDIEATMPEGATKDETHPQCCVPCSKNDSSFTCT